MLTLLFSVVMLQCCEMFDALGIPYIQSSGEAEAMCAMLNAQGVSIYLTIMVHCVFSIN